MGVWDAPPTKKEVASVWDTPPTEKELAGYDATTGTGKVFNPSSGVTETRVGYRLVAPSEQGNTTGRASEKFGRTLGDTDREHAEEDPGLGRTIGHQLLSGFAKGGGDEVVGGMTALSQKPENGKSTPGYDPSWETYRTGRDPERRLLKAAEEHHPVASFLSSVGGDIGSDLAAAAFGQNVLGLPYQVATGALRGYLSSDTDLTPDRATDADKTRAAIDTGVGAAVPLALRVPGALAKGVPLAAEAIEKTGPGNRIANSQLAKWFEEGADQLGKKAVDVGEAAASKLKPVTDAAGKAIRWPGEALDDFAKKRALKAAGYIQKDMKPIMLGEGKEALLRRGDDLLKEGAVGFGRTVDDIAPRVAQAKEKYGAKMGEILRAADDSGAAGFDARNFVDKARAEIVEKFKNDPATKAEATAIGAMLDDYEKSLVGWYGTPKAGFADANAMKSRLQDMIYDSGRSQNSKKLLKQLQHMFLEEIDSQIDGAAGKATGAAFREAKNKFGSLTESSDIAKEGVARLEGNRWTSPSDYAMGMLGAVSGSGHGSLGSLAGAAAVGTGGHLLRTRGASSAAVTARGLANLYLGVIDEAPWVLGEFGSVIAREKTPEARLAMTEALRTSYPKFAEMFEGLKQRLASRPEGSAPEARREP